MARNVCSAKLVQLYFFDVMNPLFLQASNDGFRVRFVQAQVFINTNYLTAPIYVDNQHTQIRGICRLTLSTTDVPGIAHHQLEVILVVDRSRDVLRNR